MLWLIGTAVVVVGALLATQPLLNARIAGAAGHPIYGTLFSVTVSTLTMLVAATLLRLPWPDLRADRGKPALDLERRRDRRRRRAQRADRDAAPGAATTP